MELRLLNEAEMKKIYDDCLVNDFPAAERMPFPMMTVQLKKGYLRPYGLFSEGERSGYAFFTVIPGAKTAMLDYFAIRKEYRCGGLGTEALRCMGEVFSDYDCILVEAEAPEVFGAEETRRLKERRIGFYRRNGFTVASETVRTFGVCYRVAALPLRTEPTEEKIIGDYLRIYDVRLGSRFRRRLHVRVVKKT